MVDLMVKVGIQQKGRASLRRMAAFLLWRFYPEPQIPYPASRGNKNRPGLPDRGVLNNHTSASLAADCRGRKKGRLAVRLLLNFEQESPP